MFVIVVGSCIMPKSTDSACIICETGLASAERLNIDTYHELWIFLVHVDWTRMSKGSPLMLTLQ